MADSTGSDFVIKGGKRFFQRCEIVVRQVLVAQTPEKVRAAFRPMQLIKVDPVGLQSAQAVIQGGANVLTVESRTAVANVADAVAGAGDLGCEYPVGSIAAAVEVVANVLLGGGVGFRARRNGIHLRSIDEVDASGFGHVDLSEGVSLGVLLAPCHGAEAE